MLADEKTTPNTLPPGFSFIDDEPPFVPSRHLCLEMPSEIMTLEDFGYGPEQTAQFASPVIVTSPARILSEEGIETVQYVLDLLEPRKVTQNDSAGSQGRRNVYFGEYQSRFLRDLAGCPEMTSFVSEVFQSPMAPHTMPHLGCQINFANEKPGGVIVDWHHDIAGFSTVLTMHDATRLEGGHLMYFKGTRDEGLRLLQSGQPLPEDRLVISDEVPKGYAVIMQGSAVLHAVQPLQNEGFRCSIINSFVSRDVSAPDPNHGFMVGGFYPDLPSNPIYAEMARHAAWRCRARLGTILEDLPWTTDRDAIIDELTAAMNDVAHCVHQLKTGDISFEQYTKERALEDERRMTTSVFDPASVK